jgi:hypothetical protein
MFDLWGGSPPSGRDDTSNLDPLPKDEGTGNCLKTWEGWDGTIGRHNQARWVSVGLSPRLVKLTNVSKDILLVLGYRRMMGDPGTP